MEIKKEELEKLYRKKTNAELCSMLGVCNQTLTNVLRSHGIQLKGKGGGVPRRRKIKIV